MERLIAAERRAAAAEALLARYQERERMDNEARAKRRQDAADRKRKSRAGHAMSQPVTVTTCDDAGHCVTPPSPLSPQVSSSSPTPLITTSFPPITPTPENSLVREISGPSPDKPQRFPTDEVRDEGGEYPREFELAWSSYPKRFGGNAKRDALKAWDARVRSGIDSDVMHDGTLRYAAFCLATGKVGTEFVMQGSRFYGPSQRYAEAWEIPESAKPRMYSGALSPEDFKRLSA